jgi:hypothetical protein
VAIPVTERKGEIGHDLLTVSGLRRFKGYAERRLDDRISEIANSAPRELTVHAHSAGLIYSVSSSMQPTITERL